MSPFSEASYPDIAGMCSRCFCPYTVAEVYALVASAQLNLCAEHAPATSPEHHVLLKRIQER
jgi:hypothetical protein